MPAEAVEATETTNPTEFLPAGTMTDAGTVTADDELLMAIVAPPAGATPVMEAVAVAEPPGFTAAVGTYIKDITGRRSVRVAVLVVFFQDAAIVTVVEVATADS